FSSRRRHTRFSRDWSSDVCSSDLVLARDLVDLALGLDEPRAALQHQVDAFAPAELALGSEVSRHLYAPSDALHAALLGRPAAVVGNRRHVRDVGDLEAHRVEGAHRRFAAGARSADVHFQVLDAELPGLLAGLLRGHLRGERRALARTAETAAAGSRPAQRVPLPVRDRDDRVVERRVHVRDAVNDGLLDLLPGCANFCHEVSLSLLLLDGAARALAGTRVGARALAADRQAAPVTDAPVAAEVHQALDVHRHLAPQVALELV